MSFNSTTKQVHSIDFDGCRPPKIWEKKFGHPQSENRNRAFDTRKEYHHPRGSYTSRGEATSEAKTNYYIVCIMKET
jgi:hypothetical protein